jgi:cyclophilin family peptidyl-prolyl cis-trans isomerase
MNRPLCRKLHVTLLATALGLTTFITACGGGGGSAAEVRVASVSAITADTPPTYDNLATFSVAGINLDVGVTASATGCTGPAVLSGATTTAVKVTCTPSRDGDISLSVSATGGAMLKTANFTVPKPQVRMTTSLGSLLIELEPAKAPITVKNFLAYVQDGFYVNTVFHRIISTFMAQGGGFTFGTNYTAKTPTRPAITLEKTSATGLSNTAKTIAMARTSAADSATSQFFINLVDNAFLNAQGSSDGNGYAVFGTVVTTTDVNSDATLAALKAVPVLNNGAGEVSLPANPPVVSAVSRVR